MSNLSILCPNIFGLKPRVQIISNLQLWIGSFSLCFFMFLSIPQVCFCGDVGGDATLAMSAWREWAHGGAGLPSCLVPPALPGGAGIGSHERRKNPRLSG